MVDITIFTPAYNRAEELKRAYESLKRQTNDGFLWLIVDDGSTDDTPAVVESFQKDNLVDINYIRRENGGKMRAHNTGVNACETELFMCLDSDDHLSDTAVDVILDTWQGIRDDNRYAGIIAYKGESAEKPLYGTYFPEGGDCSFRELYRRGFKGETSLVFRTELLKADLFPEIEGEKYVPEDVVYDRIDEGHVFRVLPEILTICELLEDGYTDRVEELRLSAPTGWFIYYYQRALSWPWSVMKFKYAAHYLRFRKLVDIKYKSEYRLPLGIRLSGIPGYIALSVKGKS
ncbi:MAG: glycosyltransferase family 2 protein [Lachnospiraceae bacterium]|nr:glycosyltransferase family 2 protein [Lachnospiraceae bacterium]